MAVCEVKKITYTYPTGETALKDCDFSLERGETALLAGPSGSGKSTLLRLLAGLAPEFYGGTLAGKYLYMGQDMRNLAGPELAREIGIVFQDPEKQLLMTGLERELVFGMENIGCSPAEMGNRLDEIMGYFDLSPLLNIPLQQLSGGQKQKVVLAAVMAVRPKLLLLDEPTSQLDPQAAAEFMSLVRRLSKQQGVTVVIAEQRLERVLPFVERVVHFHDGCPRFDGGVQQFLHWAVQHDVLIPDFYKYFATINRGRVPMDPARVKLDISQRLPKSFTSQKGFISADEEDLLVRAKSLAAGYVKEEPVIKEIKLGLSAGEFVSVLGANGAGKSTLLKTMCGFMPHYQGTLSVCGVPVENGCAGALVGSVGYLSQNPNDYLFRDTVTEELLFTLTNMKLPDNGQVERTLRQLGLWEVRHRYPRDLSGGQRQRVALASVLVSEPRLLLLDEPTRGLDMALKQELGHLIARLQQQGIAIMMVTHDVEFVAKFGSRVIILEDGAIIADGDRYQVLGSDHQYTPQLSRAFNSCGVLTFEDAMTVTGGVGNAQNF